MFKNVFKAAKQSSYREIRHHVSDWIHTHVEHGMPQWTNLVWRSSTICFHFTNKAVSDWEVCKSKLFATTPATKVFSMVCKIKARSCEGPKTKLGSKTSTNNITNELILELLMKPHKWCRMMSRPKILWCHWQTILRHGQTCLRNALPFNKQNIDASYHNETNRIFFIGHNTNTQSTKAAR